MARILQDESQTELDVPLEVTTWSVHVLFAVLVHVCGTLVVIPEPSASSNAISFITGRTPAPV
jgi:hypothetical protein